MIDFNRPAFTGKEFEYIRDAVERGMLCGDGIYTKKCSAWMEKRFHAGHVMLTTSCTHALEMAAFLADIQPGDEVIMPSYTFVSTADAFVLRGAKIVFVDIRPDTMNINEKLIEQAITEKTKAIVPVHYAGVACEMDTIMDIAKRHNLLVIEDAAQGVMSSYKGKALGTIGDYGCFSFHETKNYSMGEGGAILINRPEQIEDAEIIREKLLWCLDREVPHGTAVEINKFSERDNGIIDLDATIYCEKASHKGIIIGRGGEMLKRISSAARRDIEKFMGTKVYMETWVKVKENWRDNPNFIRSQGYNEE